VLSAFLFARRDSSSPIAFILSEGKNLHETDGPCGSKSLILCASILVLGLPLT